MKNSAIAIDSWKLPIFKKHLDDSGYDYTEHRGVTEDTLLLKVTSPTIESVHVIVKKANAEAQQWKKNQKLN